MSEEITCSTCSVLIPNRHIDWIAGRAYCASCRQNFPVPAFVPDPERLLQRWSEVVSRTGRREKPVWTLRWYAPHKFIALIPAAILLPIALGLFFVLDQGPSGLVIVVALTLMFGARALLAARNKTTLTLDADALEVKNAPIPYPFGAKKMNWSAVTAIRVIGSQRRFPGNRADSYRVLALTADETVPVFVDLWDAQLANELAGVLEAARLNRIGA
ncbi:hypothetical protein [Acanthopleuribacter pedis]|uniref:PH domain-containing protein n=1 Tax=Acanthopleuribacter pedis TaxID=442870 RepID=A0A8J7QE39_9BACT|nr:hypothetical protein [Acanthopleuribacter pedis]MBO1319271.1 hypothetical protein [Acanthopleuribacter pedis]